MSESERRAAILLSAQQAPLLVEEAIGGVSGSFIERIRWWLDHGAGITGIKLPRNAKGPVRAWAVPLGVGDGRQNGDGGGDGDGHEEGSGSGTGTGARRGAGRGARRGARAGGTGRTKVRGKAPSNVSPKPSTSARDIEAGPLTLPYMYVYEERVEERTSTCDQCRIIGWGTHPVSLVRYHFIIPAETGPDSLGDAKSLVALTEVARRGGHPGAPFSLPDKPSMEGPSATTSSSSYGAQSTIYDSIKHRLHGVIHANGYGHLLRVNGVYGGSSRMTGLQIFALWDALCDRLGAQSVTVEDVSEKSGMELRIAYLLAYGCTWYGLLGYGFGRGPYNITERRWMEAGTYVSSVNVSQLLHDFRGVEDRVVAVIQRYCLPVPGAVEVRDFGALMYRLMYLQLNPEQAGPFFDDMCIGEALRVRGVGLGGEMAVKRKKAPSLLATVTGKRGKVDSKTGNAVIVDTKKRGTANKVSGRSGNQKVWALKTNPTALASAKRSTKDTARRTTGKANGMASNQSAGIKNTRQGASDLCESEQLGTLRYKADVGHHYMDRARMLLQCIRSLIPSSKDMLDDQVSTKKAVDAKLAKIIEGPEAPPVTFEDTWFEFLPELLRWSQKMLGFRGVDAGAAIKVTGSHKDIVEIDMGFLHRIKMFPETWILPLRKATILQYNGVERDGLVITRNGQNIPGQVSSSSAGTGVSSRSKREKPAPKGAKVSAPGPTKLGVSKSKPKFKVEEVPQAQQDAPKVPATVDEYIKMSVDSMVQSLWSSAVCPSTQDDDAPVVARPWHELEPGSTVDDPTDPVKLRNQITADMHMLFMCTLKMYIPELAKIAGHNAAVELGQRHVAKIVKGKQISREVGVLRDTKHFIKRYRASDIKHILEDMRAGAMPPPGKPGTIRVCTTLVMPEELTSPDTSTRSGKKAMLPVQPPTEVVDMPGSSSVGDYLRVMTKLYGEMYALCKRFKAIGTYISVEREENPKHPLMKKLPKSGGVFLPEETRLNSLLTQKGGKAKGMQAVLALDVVGCFGNEVKVDWMLHAGGAQDWTVNCPCGTFDDDGAEMVACTKCETWFHTRCIKPPDAPDTETSWAKTYTCNRCLGIQQLKSPHY
jgi:hypothetical protein